MQESSQENISLNNQITPDKNIEPEESDTKSNKNKFIVIGIITTLLLVLVISGSWIFQNKSVDQKNNPIILDQEKPSKPILEDSTKTTSCVKDKDCGQEVCTQSYPMTCTTYSCINKECVTTTEQVGNIINKSKEKVCPEGWISNQMPGSVGFGEKDNSLSSEYFIIDGQRQEIENYDLDWIVENCEVNKPMTVY